MQAARWQITASPGWRLIRIAEFPHHLSIAWQVG
jgi:hypothetical protein